MPVKKAKANADPKTEPKTRKTLVELKKAKKDIRGSLKDEAAIAFDACLETLEADPLGILGPVNEHVAAVARDYGLQVSDSPGGYLLAIPD